MTKDVRLDVRGMSPPEPIERVMATIGDFGPDDRLLLVIDCHPKPLFRMLERDGYAYRVEAGKDSVYEITITRR